MGEKTKYLAKLITCGENMRYVAGLIAIFMVGGMISYLILTKQEEAPMANTDTPITELGELEITDIVVGEGTEAVSGTAVVVHYTGTLEDGTKFDSSVDRDEPFTFNLGAGEVIPGWDMGVAGMKVGGKRILTIPSHLGYGEADMGTIPSNSTLIFEVELIEVLDFEEEVVE